MVVCLRSDNSFRVSKAESENTMLIRCSFRVSIAYSTSNKNANKKARLRGLDMGTKTSCRLFYRQETLVIQARVVPIEQLFTRLPANVDGRNVL